MGVICAAISETFSLAKPVSFVLDAPVGEPAHVHQPIGRPNNYNYQYIINNSLPEYCKLYLSIYKTTLVLHLCYSFSYTNCVCHPLRMLPNNLNNYMYLFYSMILFVHFSLFYHLLSKQISSIIIKSY